MSTMAFQITSRAIVDSTNYSGADKKNIKGPRHWLCEGNSPVSDKFPTQRASNAENVAIWWRHNDANTCYTGLAF